jgi:hypothetical protein
MMTSRTGSNRSSVRTRAIVRQMGDEDVRHDEMTATTRRAIPEWSTGAGDDGVRMTETLLDFDPVLRD